MFIVSVTMACKLHVAAIKKLYSVCIITIILIVFNVFCRKYYQTNQCETVTEAYLFARAWGIFNHAVHRLAADHTVHRPVSEHTVQRLVADRTAHNLVEDDNGHTCRQDADM